MSFPRFDGHLDVPYVQRSQLRGFMATPRKYPAELKDGAVRLVFQTREESGEERGAIGRVSGPLAPIPRRSVAG